MKNHRPLAIALVTVAFFISIASQATASIQGDAKATVDSLRAELDAALEILAGQIHAANPGARFLSLEEATAVVEAVRDELEHLDLGPLDISYYSKELAMVLHMIPDVAPIGCNIQGDPIQCVIEIVEKLRKGICFPKLEHGLPPVTQWVTYDLNTKTVILRVPISDAGSNPPLGHVKTGFSLAGQC